MYKSFIQMDLVLLYSILGGVIVFLPAFVLFFMGPEITKRRIIYAVTGFLTAGAIGIFLFFLSLDTRFDWPTLFVGRLVRAVGAALTEELVRYPAIILAQYLAGKWISDDSDITINADEENVSDITSRLIEGDFTKIIDPHGMALFFGTCYGMGETLAFYIWPTIEEFLYGTPRFRIGEEIYLITLRITAVIAHIGLTYLAMAITSYRGYWRVTILLHASANAANRIFSELSPNFLSEALFIMFTRFAIVLVAYFLLRPKVRYLSPAVLIFLLVCLFLLLILIFTFIALFIGLIETNLLDTFG